MTADLISGRLGGEEFPAQVLGREHRRYPAPGDEREAFAELPPLARTPSVRSAAGV